VVPDYVTSTDIMMPSAMVMAFSVCDAPSPEAVYLAHLRTGHADWNIDAHTFVAACGKLLEIDGRHFESVRCVDACHQTPPKRDALPLECLKALGAICTGLFTNVTSSLPYTSDSSVNSASGKPRDVDRLCNGMHEMLGCDCEDGACHHMGTYLAVVRNRNVWQSDEMRWAARVLDLYRIVDCKMVCGGSPNSGGGRFNEEGNDVDDGVCHIHAPLVHRDYLYGMLCEGIDRGQRAGVVTPAEVVCAKRAALECCYPPDWAYQRDASHARGRCTERTPGSSVDEVRQYARRRDQSTPPPRGMIEPLGAPGSLANLNSHPLPLVLYLESTNVVVPFQMPASLVYKGAAASELRNIAHKRTRGDTIKQSLREFYRARRGEPDHSGEWMNFDSWWCLDTLEEAFSTPERDTSTFYRAVYSASIVNMALITAMEDDVTECVSKRGKHYRRTNVDLPRITSLINGDDGADDGVPESSTLYFMDTVFTQAPHERSLGAYHKYFASGSTDVALMPTCWIRSRDEFVAMYYACSLEPPIMPLTLSRASSCGMPSSAEDCVQLRVHPAFMKEDVVQFIKTRHDARIEVCVQNLGDWHDAFAELAIMNEARFEQALAALGLNLTSIETLYKFMDRAYARDAIERLGTFTANEASQFVHDIYEYALRACVCLIRIFIQRRK